MFTYEELSNYGEIVNECARLTDGITVDMAGAYPDNSRHVDLDAALRGAQLLVANAQALANELTALAASQR